MPQVPGNRRRVVMRRLIGRPGSLRRWALASIVALPLAVASMNFYLIVAVLLFSTIWVMYLRTTLVEGDEDEMRDWLRWQLSSKNPERHVSGQPAEEPTDPTDWFNSRGNTFIGVPAPPILGESSDQPKQDGADGV